MLNQLIHQLGYFLIPQAIVSAVTLGLIAAYLLAAVRGELAGDVGRPLWRRPLDSLASIAVSLGLLGSVWSFMQTFSNANAYGRLDIDRVIAGLGTAYTTTGVGLITAITAAAAVFLLDAITKSNDDAA